jgi:hypothetical protein
MKEKNSGREGIYTSCSGRYNAGGNIAYCDRHFEQGEAKEPYVDDGLLLSILLCSTLGSTILRVPRNLKIQTGKGHRGARSSFSVLARQSVERSQKTDHGILLREF